MLALSSAERGIARLRHRHQQPRAALADDHLDGAVGPEAIATVRAALGFSLPGLIVAAHRLPEVQGAIAAMGLSPLDQPVRPAELRTVIRQRRDGRGARLEAQVRR